jgi:hypothetical protein
VNADDVTVIRDDPNLSPEQATEFARSVNWEQESVRVASEIGNADSDITWSDWWVVRGNLDNEREWKAEQTRAMLPRSGQVRLIIQCNADVAATISAGHYDDLIVEQYKSSGEGPLPDRDRLLSIAAALREQADLLIELAGGE